MMPNYDRIIEETRQELWQAREALALAVTSQERGRLRRTIKELIAQIESLSTLAIIAEQARK